jgi:membrane dipeptidase
VDLFKKLRLDFMESKFETARSALQETYSLALKKKGGVIQIVGFASYLRVDPPERTAALAKLNDDFGLRGGRGGRGANVAGNAPPACPIEDPRTTPAPRGGGRGGAAVDGLSPDRRNEYDKRLAEIDARWPAAGRANVKDLVNHIDYAVKLIGIDHVGISSDFDGGGGIDGWNSAAEAFNVTLELVRRGYSEQQIAKLWGGNLLRVWREVEKVAKNLQKTK